jgi:uncharacterized membrane protein
VAARQEHHGTFGQDAFGRGAERAARFFGTPQYILGQSVVVVVWIAVNSIGIALDWDPYRSSCSTLRSRPRRPTQRR